MTHVRDTSIEAYRAIEAEGLLSKMLWRSYKIMFEHGPLTATQFIQHVYHARGEVRHTGPMQACLTRLRDVGVLRELGTVICPVTGRNVILWDVTSRLPVKYEKPLSKLQAARKRIAELEAENAALKAQLKKWGRPKNSARALEPSQEALL